jgi:hypothetical protein
MTPTASILARATEQKTVEDKLGRVLAVRRLTALDTLRLFKAAGPVLAQNQPWLGVAGLAVSVTAIDGVPIPVPTNETQIEAVVQRLGDEGLAAIADAFEQDAGSTIGTPADNAGNSLGTPT